MFHTIGTYAIYIVCAVFMLGMAGSAIVVLISFFDDFTELFSDEEIEPLPTRQPTT
jgi:hypothetical protein